MALARARVSGSFGIGPFRFKLSAGKSGMRATEGIRVGRRGYVNVSEPVGGKRRKR
jgi:hypothetical protein